MKEAMIDLSTLDDVLESLVPNITPPVQATLAQLGRTEDVRFSPDNRRLALAGYGEDTCLLLDIRIDASHPDGAIAITGFTKLISDDLVEPHGFDFIDDDTLVVANRKGSVAVFDLSITSCEQIELEARHRITRANWMRRIHSPGSVLVKGPVSGGAEILVCNNYRKRVTAHRIGRDGRISNRVALSLGLDVPDGIACTPDGRWLAISDHFTNSALIYDCQGRLTPRTAPVGRLTGMAYPHGLRFSPDGRYAFVAYAGAPVLHVFRSDTGQWMGDHAPLRSVKVLSDEVFQRGRTNDAEGGPKGVDIDNSGTILVVTCEEQPLAFFRVADLI